MFTDSHCHLDFTEFDANRESLINACAQHGIHQFIVPGITAKRWQRVLQLCQQYPQAKPCLGLHPWWIHKATKDDIERLNLLLTNTHIVAVGEIGIDGAIADIEKQIDYFIQQLHLAKQHNLPVVIHHRKSHHLIVPELKKIMLDNTGVIHAFSGNYQQAKAYIDLGYKLGIGGTITYPRASKTRDAITKIPLSSMLLETDAPAMPLSGSQGKINSPENIRLIFKHLCALRSESEELLAQKIEENVKSLFRLG